jgi:hypothetical protein
VHDAFCLNPLHPGPCRGPRTTRREGVRGLLPGAGPLGRPPAKKAAPAPPPRKANQGRARVGGPIAPVPPPRKAAKKVAPARALPRGPGRGVASVPGQNSPANRAASDAGAVAQILMGGGNVTPQFVEGLMKRVRAAHQADQREGRGGPDSNYSRLITEESLAMATVLANQGGGTAAERRQKRTRYANIISEAMRSGDPRQARTLRRELDGARTASAARQGEALAYFGLRVVEGAGLWADQGPAYLSPLSSLAHLECNLAVFCRNPLHPGPCKGWKGTLAKVAPGTLKLIEEERKKKLAAKKAAKAAAMAKASKIVDKAKRGEEVDAHPNAKKKLAKKATEQILGTDEEKIAAIEGSTQLTQKEMSWHANKKAAALLAANMAAGNLKTKAAQQKYKQAVRADILAALKADNESGLTGPDSEYQKTINKWASALSNGHADQHVKPQNEAGDNLHGAVADAFHAAVVDDLKNATAGHPGVSMKKLTKALKDIPGEPGDPDHDAAVGKAVGHDVAPEDLTDKPVVLPGALSEEDADKLAAGAAHVAGLTGSPEQAANGSANAKKLAQMEGFTDKQAAMVTKTATNQAGLAAAQHSDGLDGFSPQGKKKFEKQLAGEMVAMLDNGEGPQPGSLAELVAMKKAGLISADEFHAEVQKKLKIKSKKLSAKPNAPADGAAGGGAGAGGLTKAQAVGVALDDLYQELEPGKPNSSKMVGEILADPNTPEADKIAGAKSHAEGMATTLLNSLPTDTLTPDEKEALHQVTSDMIQAVMQNPDHVGGAKNLIKNLKKKSPSDLKAFANGMLPASKQGGDSDGGAPSGPVSPYEKKVTIDNAQKAKKALDKEMGATDSSATYNAGSLGSYLGDTDDAQEHDEILNSEAETMAVKSVNSGAGADLGPTAKQKLIDKTSAKFKKALQTGHYLDIAEAKAAHQQNASAGASKLNEVANTAVDEPTVNVQTDVVDTTPASGTPGGGPKPLTAATDNTQAAAIIATQAQAAYEKLLPGSDGSPLSSVAAIGKLAQTLDNGQEPGVAAQKAAQALAKAYMKKKLVGYKSQMPLLHEAALTDALAAEIEEGIVTGKFPEGGLLDKMGSPKFGFVKLKIAAKKEYDKSGGLPPKPMMSGPLLPTSSKQQALDDALDDAFGPTPTPGGPPPTPSAALQSSLAPTAAVHVPLIGKAIDKYQAAMAAATTDEEKADAVKSLAGSFAGAKIFGVLDELDISMGDLDKDQFIAMSNKLTDDFVDAINADADAPGGLAGALSGILKSVTAEASKAQKANGFTDGSAALNDYKQALFEAEVDEKLNASVPATTKPGGGAGAGGTGTGVNPATAAQKPSKGATATLPKPPGKPLPPLPPAGAAPDLKTFKKKSGAKGGGTYEDANGVEHSVKQQKSPEHARNEAMASALYRAGGIHVPPVHVGTGAEGLTGTQTSAPVVPGAVPFDPSNPAHVAAVRRGFAMDAWLGNWSAVGLSNENIVIGPDGTAHRINVGGSLLYRAEGEPKGNKFGDTVGELETLRDPSLNPSGAKVFNGMTTAEMIQSLEQVEAITPDQIRDIVAAQGGDAAMAKRLIARREDLMKRLKTLRELPPKGPGESDLNPADVKLAGTKKKQKIMSPKGGYPIAQVVVEGHENSVDEYNARVAAGKNGKSAATPPTKQMADLPSGAGRSSVKAYTGSSYHNINGHLRAGKKGGATGPGKHVANIDKVMEGSRLTEPITVMRGFRGSTKVFGPLWSDRRDQNWSGAEFRDLAYGSTSVNMSTARSFAGAGGPDAVVMRVHMPVGTRALNLGGASNYASEAEILLNRGARFRIVADNGYQNGARHLDVEVICDGDGCADAV